MNQTTYGLFQATAKDNKLYITTLKLPLTNTPWKDNIIAVSRADGKQDKLYEYPGHGDWEPDTNILLNTNDTLQGLLI